MRRIIPALAVLAGLLLSACTAGSSSSTRRSSLTGITAPPGSSSALATATSTAAPGSTPGASLPGTPTVLASGLAVPWGLAFLPDGSALVSERDSHRIVHIAVTGQTTVVATVPGVADNSGEGGLLGLALSPTYSSDALVYAYLTSPTDNRVVRMTYRAGTLATPSVVFAGIPKAAIHDGGRIAFGPDQMLYVTTGDAGQKDRAPDPSYLGGKVLRMTPDGAPAPGNPFSNSVVYTLGHRNPQGLAWGPDATLYEAEFGQNTLDEINLIEAGKNYGWPVVEGTIGPRSAALTGPLLTWNTNQASPSGLAFAGNTLWLATLQGKRVYRIPVLGPGQVGTPTGILDGQFGRLRTIVAAPDGALWLTTSNRDGRGDPSASDDRVIRLPLI